MGAGASIPGSEEDALAQGYSPDQIAGYLHNKEADPETTPTRSPDLGPEGSAAESVAGEEADSKHHSGAGAEIRSEEERAREAAATARRLERRREVCRRSEAAAFGRAVLLVQRACRCFLARSTVGKLRELQTLKGRTITWDDDEPKLDSAPYEDLRDDRAVGDIQKRWGHFESTIETNLASYDLHDHLAMPFPMYAMPMSTFMAMEKMQPFEVLLAAGEVTEWDPSKGPVFFLSHQWTAFNEPDHTGIQLRTAQEIFRAMQISTVDACFASPQEWLNFSHKDPTGGGTWPYSAITVEDLQKEANEGFIWLDFACIPQASNAREERIKAVESIPREYHRIHRQTAGS